MNKDKNLNVHKPKINVLLAHDHLGWDGTVMHGVSRLFLQWMPVFNKSRFNVVLYVMRKRDALSYYFERRGIEVRYLGKGKYNPIILLSFLRIIRKEEMDLFIIRLQIMSRYAIMRTLGRI